MDVSFVRSSTLSAFAAKVTASEIVPGAWYFVTVSTNPSIISLFRGLTANTYEVLMGNVVATPPTLGANGQSLTYKDAGGNDKTIDLSGITVGDKTTPSDPLPMGDGGGDFTGVILKGDSIAKALAKLSNRMDDEFPTFATEAELNALAGDLASMFSSLLDFQGHVNSTAEVQALTTMKVGETYRVGTAGTYELLDAQLNPTNFVCEVGDLLICINPHDPYTGAASGWTVLQNNIDFTAIMSGVSANSDTSKMLVSLSWANGVLTTSYATLVSRILTDFAATADTGNISAADTLTKALSRLQNRIATLETSDAKHTAQLTWTII